jgi:hypothetical protein
LAVWMHGKKVAVQGAELYLGLMPIRRESCAVCHVERSEAQSRHLATNLACRSFGARFLRFGLRSK